jgi:hypothetical protein
MAMKYMYLYNGWGACEWLWVMSFPIGRPRDLESTTVACRIIVDDDG